MIKPNIVGIEDLLVLAHQHGIHVTISPPSTDVYRTWGVAVKRPHDESVGNTHYGKNLGECTQRAIETAVKTIWPAQKGRGKFIAKDELAQEIADELEGANPGTLYPEDSNISVLAEITHCLTTMETIQANYKKHIEEGLSPVDPDLYEVEHLVRMAIPLLRGAKAKLDHTRP